MSGGVRKGDIPGHAAWCARRSGLRFTDVVFLLFAAYGFVTFLLAVDSRLHATLYLYDPHTFRRCSNSMIPVFSLSVIVMVTVYTYIGCMHQ